MDGWITYLESKESPSLFTGTVTDFSWDVTRLSELVREGFLCTIGAVSEVTRSEVTRILGSIAQGDSKAAEGLLALVYDEVRKLAARYPRKAEWVKLRYFLGMTFEEAAAALDIALPTAKEWWAYAHAWLAVELRKSG